MKVVRSAPDLLRGLSQSRPLLRSPLLLVLAGFGAMAGCGDAGRNGPPANSPPKIQFVSHRSGDKVDEGALVDISAQVTDDHDAPLALSARWLLETQEICATAPPESSGITSCRYRLPAGDARILLEVADSEKALTRGELWLQVQSTQAPTLVIQQPFENQSFAPGEALILLATVADAEDPPGSLVVSWRSDLDGPLPPLQGPSVAGALRGQVQLTPGTHAITLRVEDSSQKSVTKTLHVVQRAPNQAPSCQLLSPADGASGRAEDGLRLNAQVADADVNSGPQALSLRISSDLDGLLGTPQATRSGAVTLLIPSLSAGSHALRLEATDPEGASCSDQRLYTATAAPSVLITAPTPGAHLVGLALDFSAQLSDDRDLPQNLVTAWSDDLGGPLGAGSVDATGLARLPGIQLALGSHQISLSVSDSDGQQTSAFLDLQISADAPPSTPRLHLSPVAPQSSDDLVAVIDTPSVDPEGQPVSYRYAWSVDGSPSTQTGSSVPAAQTAVGQLWRVQLFPSDGGQEGSPGSASVTIQAAPPPPTGCALPVSYSRVTHALGAINFSTVAFAPDGSYALLLARPRGLYRYDAAPGTLSLIDAGSGSERWQALRFENSGAFALVGGDDGAASPAPKLYRYDEGTGLTQVTGLTGLANGALPTVSRIKDIVQRPALSGGGAGAQASFTLLTDNGGSWPSQITYLNEVVFDWSGGAHSFSYHGGLNTSQGAASLDWGSFLGQPIALAVSHYLEIMRYEPLLTGTQFSLESAPNHGNLSRVIFDPSNRQVAWLLQWSGSGKVYAWEGQLYNDTANSFGFSGWSMADFAVRPEGDWKVFVGRNGNIWFSDSPWRPMDATRFSNQALPAFDQPPWSGSSNAYLTGATFRPGLCEGLIVGDATAGMGLVVKFSMTAL